MHGTTRPRELVYAERLTAWVLKLAPDAPEELNLIEKGKHYGFPYVFGNNEKPNYTDSPAAPAGLKFEAPIKADGQATLCRSPTARFSR